MSANPSTIISKSNNTTTVKAAAAKTKSPTTATPPSSSSKATPPPPPPASPSKSRGVRKDISMLMFLLAAETAVVSSISDSPGSILAAGAAAASAAHRASTPPSATTDATGKNGMTFSSHSDTSSRNGETDSSASTLTPTPEEEEEELLVDMRSAATASGKQGQQVPTKLLVIDATIMSKVLGYVPWKEVARLRGVNRAWLRASETIVQIRQMPNTTKSAAFLLCPKDLDSDKTTEKALQFVHPSTWRCVMCGFWNAETRVLCGNRQCQCPSLTHAGCARIFLGQLRRDATVPFIQWLVTRVLEAPSELRNVENHRHNVTNRGKGCAWAYFKSDAVAQDLLSYHRRMFLDVVDGNEGLWIVKEADIDALNTVASERGYTPLRPKCLPRNALVVEPPATGSSQMGRDLLLSNYNVACQYAEEPSPAQSPVVPDVPKARHGRTSSITSTTASVTTSEYRHNPYSYSPIHGSGPSYSWADNVSNVATGAGGDTESSCTSILPSVSAPPAYDEAAFMTTAPYGSNAANSTYNSHSHHHYGGGGHSQNNNSTYYSSTGSTYNYEYSTYY